MPPERNVPARSRGVAADTCRTPQPIRQTARTPTDSNRAHGMSSSYRSQHVQRAAPARLRHPRRSADPWPTESPDQRSLRLNGIAAPATADPGAIGDLRCSCTEEVSHDDGAFTDLMEQQIRPISLSFGPAMSDHEMALTAVDNLDLNASGMGIYPLSANPFWPGPMVACRNAFTAVPTWLSGYFEQTTS